MGTRGGIVVEEGQVVFLNHDLTIIFYILFTLIVEGDYVYM